PYVEGLTMAEATNELAFLVTGAYGKPVSKSQGAPLRLAVPWKYGFKSIKSITRFSFTDQRPKSFWQALAPAEYGFWANVNPEVSHPRWSQASEEVIGTGERRPTLLFNGYGDYVAGIYKGVASEPPWGGHSLLAPRMSAYFAEIASSRIRAPRNDTQKKAGHKARREFCRQSRQSPSREERLWQS